MTWMWQPKLPEITVLTASRWKVRLNLHGQSMCCTYFHVNLIFSLSNTSGDQVSRKGGMTGGFYDFRRSKLKFVKIVRENKTSIHKKTVELEEIGKKLKDILLNYFLFILNPFGHLYFLLFKKLKCYRRTHTRMRTHTQKNTHTRARAGAHKRYTNRHMACSHNVLLPCTMYGG